MERFNCPFSLLQYECRPRLGCAHTAAAEFSRERELPPRDQKKSLNSKSEMWQTLLRQFHLNLGCFIQKFCHGKCSIELVPFMMQISFRCTKFCLKGRERQKFFSNITEKWKKSVLPKRSYYQQVRSHSQMTSQIKTFGTSLLFPMSLFCRTAKNAHLSQI